MHMVKGENYWTNPKYVSFAQKMIIYFPISYSMNSIDS